MKEHNMIFKNSDTCANRSEAKCRLFGSEPIIDRLVTGNICSFFKGSPLAIIRSSEYDERIIVKIADVPWFLREIGAELCFDVIRGYDYIRNRTLLKAINVIPTVSTEYLSY